MVFGLLCLSAVETAVPFVRNLLRRLALLRGRTRSWIGDGPVVCVVDVDLDFYLLAWSIDGFSVLT